MKARISLTPTKRSLSVFLLCQVLLVGALHGGELRQGAIATAHPLATAAGFEVLEAGGNAFDAAVAISATLGVVEPSSSGFGGGGFWLLRPAGGEAIFVDARETAPASAHRDLYLDENGDHQRELSLIGPLAAGIPGLPAGLAHIAAQYGKLPLETTLAPAIRHAREGFEVDAHYLEMAAIPRIAAGLRKYPETARIFLDNGEPPTAGFRLRQPDLAETIEAVARHGHDGFYRGAVAQRLVDGVNAAGGTWTLDDLASYRIVVRTPLTGNYRGYRITTSPPPSSGGIALLTSLNILEAYTLDELTPVTRTHLVVEAMRRAYRDRAEYLGDPDFVEIPLKLLSDKAYAAGLRASIRHDRATPSDLLPRAVTAVEGTDTTHFSVLDSRGNLVAGTLSINIPFGSALVPEGTGVLLNDEMDDFSSKPGAPNIYGLVGADANAIAPGKRPLSSMTPTFVEQGEELAILGTPGGSRIISMVLLGVLDFTSGERDPGSWTAVERFHHQYLPDEVQIEQGALSQLREPLKALGHRINALDRNYGNMQALYWNRATGEALAASDPRRAGGAEVR